MLSGQDFASENKYATPTLILTWRDGIEVAPGDEIILETVDELKPALLKSSDDPNFLYLLMPVRVS